MKILIPINNYVILKEGNVLEEKTESGIIIPSSRNDNMRESEVLNVNERNTEVEPGDHVLHHRTVGTPFRLNGMNLLAVRQEDLIAKVKDE